MYVVFDVETTGLNPEYDKIIEITGIELDDSMQKTREFSKTVKQSIKLNKEIVELTGITNEELSKKGEPEEKVMNEFLEFVGDQILVAHNAPFDLSMLYATVGTAKIFDFYDTLTMSLLMIRWMKQHKLNLICNEFNVELSQHHRSLYDTRATAECFYHLKRMADARNYDFKNLLAIRKENEYVFEYRKLMYPLEAPRIFAS